MERNCQGSSLLVFFLLFTFRSMNISWKRIRKTDPFIYNRRSIERWNGWSKTKERRTKSKNHNDRFVMQFDKRHRFLFCMEAFA